MNNRSELLALVGAVLIAALGCERATESEQPFVVEQNRIVYGEHENYRDFGEHVVGITAITTELIQPETARQYGIVRSENRVMLNVTLFRKKEGSLQHDYGDPMRGMVTAVVSNRAGQLKEMDTPLREIVEEGGAGIYYIGETSISEGEALVFNIDATPEGASEPILLQYRRQF